MTENNDVETMYLYTEKSTRLLYEAKLFDDFVIVRPLDPNFHDAMEKMEHGRFVDEYEEYLGDCSKVRQYMAGMAETILLN